MTHRPDPRRVQSRCRVDCTCGWRGPRRGMFGPFDPEPWALGLLALGILVAALLGA